MSAFVLTAGLVAEATGGRLIAGDTTRLFNRVVTDSRTMPAALATRGAGPLFIGLSGPSFDGNDFAAQAIAGGAAGVLVSRPVVDPGHAAVILVDDTLEALQRLGQSVRLRSGARVVAITGSAGKTTTKEAIAQLLSAKFRVYRNAGNFNNHWGLPLSLIELRQGPEFAVVELGMNHAGEISTLVHLATPDIRVWTNVGNAHIGHFGSVDAIAEAKAEILEDATSSTLVVANADDERVMRHVAKFQGRRLTFGTSAAADVQAVHIDDHGFEGTSAEVTTPWGPLSLRLALPGRANLMNVLAAVAVALECGVSTQDVEREAAALVPVDRRGASVALVNGARLIDDSYNASPAAVRATVQALAATPTSGRRIAVIGEMRELGDDARFWHEDCGRAVAEARLDLLVAVGGPAVGGLIAGAKSGGMSDDQLLRFASSQDAAPVVASLVRRGDLVLVKGSRGTRTDVIADRLKEVE